VVAAELRWIALLGSLKGFQEHLAILLKKTHDLRNFCVASAEMVVRTGAEGKRVVDFPFWPSNARLIRDSDSEVRAPVR
jgi:hypothetical protein